MYPESEVTGGSMVFNRPGVLESNQEGTAAWTEKPMGCRQSPGGHMESLKEFWSQADLYLDPSSICYDLSNIRIVTLPL